MKNKKYQLAFFGTPEFAVPALQALLTLPQISTIAVVTQPDKPVGKKQVLTPPPIKILADKNHLTVLQPDKINTDILATQLKSLRPDVCVVVAYGKIIPKKLLSIPPHGWLNVHASLLPKYRGASPIQAAILNGEQKTGVTLMQIDAGLDTGPIIKQAELAVSPVETSSTLHDKLSTLGAELLRQELDNFLKGKIHPRPQNHAQATLTKIIKKEDGKIDWHNPAEYIERQIRAYTPWPGAYCWWNNKRLKIIQAQVAKENKSQSPGEVFRHDSAASVACRKGSLQLQTLQLEGKKIQPITEFLKGYPAFISSTLT